VSPGKRRWAVAHVKARHRSPDVLVLRVLVARDTLTRRSRGVWTTASPVASSAIVSVCISELARSDGDAA
jgi:hypothetical protein